MNKTAGSDGQHAEFDDDVSMLILSSGKLWIPLKGTYIGNAGVAWILDTFSYGASYEYVPTPTSYCDSDTGPDDLGSAGVILENAGVGVVQLSSTYCGRLAYGISNSPALSTILVSDSYPPVDETPVFEFEMGEHSHPVYDLETSSLYYFNFQPSPFAPPQQLCCLNTGSGSAKEPCSGWPNVPGGCVSLPVLSSGPGPDPGRPLNYRWSWLAGGLDSVSQQLYVVASGPVDEKPLGSSGFSSQLWLFSTVDGTLLARHGITGDLYNSAPLVVLGAGSGGKAVSVILTTATGALVSFRAGVSGVTAGWAWSTTGEIGGVPVSELPSSTYSFLAVTPKGTLLVTTTGGGDAWSTEKATFAVVNGVLAPSAPTPPPSALSGAAKAGIAIGVLAGVGALMALAYAKVPAVANVLDAFVGGVRLSLAKIAALASNDSRGYTAYASSATNTSSTSSSSSSSSSTSSTGFGASSGGGGYGAIGSSFNSA